MSSFPSVSKEAAIGGVGTAGKFNSFSLRMKIPLVDKKYYLHIPDPGFSPKRNKMVIENSIKKHDAKVKKQIDDLRDPYMERAEAVVSYLRYADKKPGFALDRYFTKSYLTFLRGDEIRKKLMAGMQVKRGDKFIKL